MRASRARLIGAVKRHEDHERGGGEAFVAGSTGVHMKIKLRPGDVFSMASVNRINPLMSEIQHGYNCVKVAHTSTGYLHDELDDRPYDVDNVRYCGRCHEWLANDGSDQ
jgi:hypothetical protein